MPPWMDQSDMSMSTANWLYNSIHSSRSSVAPAGLYMISLMTTGPTRGRVLALPGVSVRNSVRSSTPSERWNRPRGSWGAAAGSSTRSRIRITSVPFICSSEASSPNSLKAWPWRSLSSSSMACARLNRKPARVAPAATRMIAAMKAPRVSTWLIHRKPCSGISAGLLKNAVK